MTWFEFLSCFVLYSFAGWALEVCWYSWKKKRFVNPGFLNGPWCPIYGAALVWMIEAFPELRGRFLFQFLAFGIVASFLQFITGHILELLFGRRWWDYSRHPRNIDGFVSLRSAVLWGAGSMVVIKFVHPLVLMAVHMVPGFLGRLALTVVLVLMAVDTLGTSVALRYWNRNLGRVGEITKELNTLSRRIGLWLFFRVQRRLERAEAAKLAEQAAEAAQEARALGAPVFAAGCCFYKLVWLFFIGAFLGDLTETVFCRVTAGVWMSRSSVVYGPFSIVWGMGVVLLTATLYRFYDREDRYIFLAGTFLGGAYEYLCSVFTERVFGTVFWDYSEIPFNLGGRINLLYCFFWGIAALVWLKVFYPRFSAWIEKIPMKTGKILSWIFILFMAYNMVISSLAMVRYVERNTPADAAAVEADDQHVGWLADFLDEHFNDQRMERIYPNAIIK